MNAKYRLLDITRKAVIKLPAKPQKVWWSYLFFSNREGEAYPSLEMLAREIEMDEKSIRKARAFLEETGWLIRLPGSAGDRYSKPTKGSFSVPVFRVNDPTPKATNPIPSLERVPLPNLPLPKMGTPTQNGEGNEPTPPPSEPLGTQNGEGNEPKTDLWVPILGRAENAPKVVVVAVVGEGIDEVVESVEASCVSIGYADTEQQPITPLMGGTTKDGKTNNDKNSEVLSTEFSLATGISTESVPISKEEVKPVLNLESQISPLLSPGPEGTQPPDCAAPPTACINKWGNRVCPICNETFGKNNQILAIHLQQKHPEYPYPHAKLPCPRGCRTFKSYYAFDPESIAKAELDMAKHLQTIGVLACPFPPSPDDLLQVPVASQRAM